MEDYQLRPEHDTPEILRSDLSQLCLALRAMQIDPGKDIEWLDSPPEAALEGAAVLAGSPRSHRKYGAAADSFSTASAAVTPFVEAVERGVGEDGCVAAALLASGFDFGTNDLLTGMDQRKDPRLQQPLEQLRKIARPSAAEASR